MIEVAAAIIGLFSVSIFLAHAVEAYQAQKPWTSGGNTPTRANRRPLGTAFNSGSML
jgi:hypothetical protein